jgi:glutathione-independent formaldehyde dehydrogenase
MRAVVYRGIHDVAVEEVEDPTVEETTDVVVRITSSALCGSDLHHYDGRLQGLEAGMVLGHEPLGVIESVGSDVASVSVGQRVVVPTHLFCGVCVMCARGHSAACLRVRAGGFGAAYGYANMGGYRGAQAELLRVPFADANCVSLPGEPGDEREDDFVLLADAFVTGWHATELAAVQPGATVAVFGAGAVGLLAAYSSRLRGAAEVYVVDAIDARLDKAGELGATPVDYRRGDPVDQIRDLRRGRGLPPGEESLDGVDCAIDAVGFQAKDRSDPEREAPGQVVSDCARLVNTDGAIGIAGVYTDDPRPPAGALPGGQLDVPWASLFTKGVRLRLGRTDDRRYTRLLRDMILAGTARPGRIVTHHGGLDDAPGLYAGFDERRDGVIKAVLRPT